MVPGDQAIRLPTEIEEPSRVSMSPLPQVGTRSPVAARCGGVVNPDVRPERSCKLRLRGADQRCAAAVPSASAAPALDWGIAKVTRHGPRIVNGNKNLG